MAVATSYPGIYIQELPSNSHAIMPAPTSIAAFVGYSHPFKTKAFNVAQQIFSFSDFETYFGGLFSSGMIDPSLGRAVYQFFLNGGSNAWVVGVQPGLHGTGSPSSALFGLLSGNMSFSVSIATSASAGMLFTATEPTDSVPMAVQVANVNTAKNTFDVIITYGSLVESYRSLSLTASSLGKINDQSALVTVAPNPIYGTTLPTPSVNNFPLIPSNLPPSYTTSYQASDLLGAFAANGSLDNVEIFNLLMVPGNCDNEVISTALSFAERKRAFAIIDPPPQAPANGASTDTPQPIQYWMTGLGGSSSGYMLPASQNGALYFPYLASVDPVTNGTAFMAPSGFVAGVFATTDANRGVWKAPAGLATVVLNTTGPVHSGAMNDPQQGVLNLDSINCLRSFSGVGTVVWGSRTLVASNTAYQQSMYVPVRRMTLFIEQTLLANLRWVVFEPNDEPLWIAIKSSIEAFLLSLYKQQALQGSSPSQAFQVTCDSTTTTSQDQTNGIVNIVVAFAPLKPAEFVVIKIAQLAGQSTGS